MITRSDTGTLLDTRNITASVFNPPDSGVLDKIMTLSLSDDLSLTYGVGAVDTSGVSAGLSVVDYLGDTWTSKLNEARFAGVRREYTEAIPAPTNTFSPPTTTITMDSGNPGLQFLDPTQAGVGSAWYDWFAGESTDGRTFMVTLRYKLTSVEIDTQFRFDLTSVSGTVARIRTTIRAAYDNSTEYDITMFFTGQPGSFGVRLQVDSVPGLETKGFIWGDITFTELKQASQTQNSMPYLNSSVDYLSGANGVKYFDTISNVWEIIAYGDSFVNEYDVDGNNVRFTSLRRIYGSQSVINRAVSGESLAQLKVRFDAGIITDGGIFTDKLYVIWEGKSDTYTSQAQVDADKDLYHKGDGTGICEQLTAAGARFLVLSTFPADTLDQSAGTAGRVWLDELNAYVKGLYPNNHVDCLTPSIAVGQNSGVPGDAEDYAAGIPAGSIRDDPTYSSVADLGGAPNTIRFTGLNFIQSAGDTLTMYNGTISAYDGEHVIVARTSNTFDIELPFSGDGSGSFRDPVHLKSNTGYTPMARACQDLIIANGWDRNSDSTPIATPSYGVTCVTDDNYTIAKENFAAGDKVITLEIYPNTSPVIYQFLSYGTDSFGFNISTNVSGILTFTIFSSSIIQTITMAPLTLYKIAVVIKSASNLCDIFINGVKEVVDSPIADSSAITDPYIGAASNGTGFGDSQIKNLNIWNDLKYDAFWKYYTS